MMDYIKNPMEIENASMRIIESEIGEHSFSKEELLIVKRIIHTTSAGTQGVTNASHADEIITGSLVNAKAIAAYIKQKNPEEVSLVCMGWQCERDTAEDVLCAEYIKSLLEDKPYENIGERALQLKELELCLCRKHQNRFRR